MIVFIYGTTAEAIKVAPVARRLDALGVPYEQWLTFQHTKALRKILPSLGLRQPDRVIADGRNGRPLRSSFDVIPWLLSGLGWLRRNRKELRRSLPPGSVVIVHGDTLTTVLGAWIARRLGVPSAHIEAGLRSGNWRHPFPEELDRRAVGKLASIHYAPSHEAVEHLAGRPNVVHTHGNTAIDAVLDQTDTTVDGGEQWGIVLLHRFEFISNKTLVEQTLAALAEASPYPVRFFVDEFAKEAIVAAAPRDSSDKLQVQGKLSHEEFITTLRNAQFVVTDSGGIQAEAALLGTPTLIHRKATEQREGIGENIVLSEWRIDRLTDFLRDHAAYRRPVNRPAQSPSDIIIEDLTSRGMVIPAST